MGRVKVIGYSQRAFYNDGIEYRNFSDGLVGQQFASGDNITFTNGNFIVGTNFDDKVSRIFKTNNYSNYFTLESLNPTNNTIINILTNSEVLSLNLDSSRLRNYALFGSLREFIRTSLETIISNWPAGLYVQEYMVTPLSITYTGNTVENYRYDIVNNVSTFTVNANQILNPYGIDYSIEALTLNSFNSDYDLRNFSINYGDYTINNESIIGYTAITDTKFGTLHIQTNGNPFPTISGSTFESYHIKPKDEIIESFFESLGDFEGYILNRLTVPKYKSTFTYTEILDSGVSLTRNKSFVWPVTDGYNIDFNSSEYIQYVTKLIDMADKSDEIDSNLISRFLTSDSISDFDSTPDCLGGEHETSGAKVNKTLKIYGREFDEILSYIDGISHAHTVSYDKKNNVPDNIIRILGRSLGWELTSSLVNSDVLSSYLTRSKPTFNGQSRGLSISEQEIEFWRRLIINTPWIWKSKGTRKLIEMLFKFIGTPQGLYKFNEYVYVANKPLDMELFQDILEELEFDSDLSYINIDSDGYPKILPNNSEMYFQKAGLWYRETGGENAFVDINTGNNPHVGPYDGGQAYLDQFGCLIPDFSSVTINKKYTTTATTNLYINDSAGDFNGVINQETVVTIVDSNGDDASEIICLTSEIVDSPKPKQPKSNCGCDFEIDDKVLKIGFQCSCGSEPNLCDFVDTTLSNTGVVTFNFTSYNTTLLTNFPNGATLAEATNCCELLGPDYEVITGYGGVKEPQCVLSGLLKPCNITALVREIDCTFGNNDGVINVTNITGDGDWGYELSIDSTIISGGTISNNYIVFNNLPIGYYHLVITDTNTCVYDNFITITEDSALCNMGYDETHTSACDNIGDGEIKITNVSGTPPFRYYLNNILISEVATDYFTFNELNSGTYNVKVIDINNCELTKTVVIPPEVSPMSLFLQSCTTNREGTEFSTVWGVTNLQLGYYYWIYHDSIDPNNLITDTNGIYGGANIFTSGIPISETLIIVIVDPNGCEVITTYNCTEN